MTLRKKPENAQVSTTICLKVLNENLPAAMDKATELYIPVQEYLSAVLNRWIEENLFEDSERP